jgi:hypothetical protein
VSPIFVRPVREQLEHDRLIRFLRGKYGRKFEVAVNVGDEQAAPVKIGANTFFPDVVLTTGKKLSGLAEVESGESVNNLEAMAQWVHFSRARVPFHLYVPVTAFDAARRLCVANQVSVAEIWTYRAAVEGFDLVRSFHDPAAVSGASGHKAAKVIAVVKPEVLKSVAKTTPVKPAAVKPVPAKPVPAKPMGAKPVGKTKAPVKPAAKVTKKPAAAKPKPKAKRPPAKKIRKR